MSAFALRRRRCAWCRHTFRIHDRGRCGGQGCRCYAFRCDRAGTMLHSLARPIETRAFAAVDVARLFDVPPHLVTDDLPAGYWTDELERRIARRRVRARARAALARLARRIR